MRTIAMAAAATLLVLASQSILAAEPGGDVAPPDAAWSVQVFRGLHPGLWLRVAISSEFSWPPGVEYRIDLSDPTGVTRERMGWLRPEARAATIPLDIGAVARDVELARGQQPAETPRDSERVNRAIALLEAGESVSPDQLRELTESLLPSPRRYPTTADILEYRVSLVPFVGGRGIPRQERNRAPQNPDRYMWGTEVPAGNDPCAGKKPEDCVRERLDAFRERICNPRTNGLPNPGRFSLMCIRLALGLSLEPPRINIVCGDLDGSEAGITAGWTDVLTRRISINGEAFLTQDCPEATFIHEDSHVVDVGTGAIPNLIEFVRWEKRHNDAVSRYREALDRGDDDAAAVARREIAEAILNIRLLEQAAGREKLRTECTALFATLAMADLFGFPGDGDAWVMRTIKDMISELSTERAAFNLPLFGNPELCDCYTRMEDWIDDYPDLQNDFDTEEFADSGITCSAALGALKNAACR